MDRTKYPRTMNLPWSGSSSGDDVWWQDVLRFAGRSVVVTEKMDGECTTIYPDGHVHARSVDSKHHPSRSWIKSFAAQICSDIPAGWRICGENLYACHSIYYTELPSHFLAFGIYNGDMCLSWDDTCEFCEMLGVVTVPVLFRGIWDEPHIRSLWTGKGRFPTFQSQKSDPSFPDDFEPSTAEGYVVRLADAFSYADFSDCCAKYVRPQHVQTDAHWMQRKVVVNSLKVLDDPV